MMSSWFELIKVNSLGHHSEVHAKQKKNTYFFKKGGVKNKIERDSDFS